MSTLEDLEDLERESKQDKQGPADQKEDADMKDADKDEDLFDPEILNASTQDIIMRRRLLENDTKIMKSEFQRLSHEKSAKNAMIKENVEKIENNR
jgi:26S proteasome regulatory subunit T5